MSEEGVVYGGVVVVALAIVVAFAVGTVKCERMTLDAYRDCVARTGKVMECRGGAR